jgi:NhaP-type Na+/H+ or K+/H+ antiporter
MAATIQTFLGLLAVLVVVAIVARRLRTAPSILLVVAGIVLAVIPGLPRIELAPELVLLGILPPLIYSAGVAMSWREFRFNLRSITLLAFGCVVFTTCAVAAAVHWLIGLPFAVGFVLGAIVAPPDAVAPLAIVRRLGLPRRLVVVLEGEGLANDATALILYRFAVAAVSTGLFSLRPGRRRFRTHRCRRNRLRHRCRLGQPEIAALGARSSRRIALSLLTPYAAFLLPQQLGGSGVLATVAAGLYVSWNGPLLIPAATRFQGIFFWDFLIYLLEGLIFLITGMQTRTLLDRMNGNLLYDLLIAALVTIVVVLVTRFVWMFPAMYLPRRLSRSLRRRDPAPPWQWTFFLGFVGVRGVVSLAAALAVPLTTVTGSPFPARDLILFVTFAVIVITLIGQGVALPLVVRWLGLGRDAAKEHERERKAELAARAEALNIAHARLKQLVDSGQISSDVHAVLRARQDYRSGRLPRTGSDGLPADDSEAIACELRSDLIAAERAYIYRLLQEGQITDEARRRIERELDLEEASIAIQIEEGIEAPL